jgi:hypothetical protein
MRTIKLLISICFFGSVIAGCASTTDTSQPTTVSAPNTGSRFFFSGGSLDASNGIVSGSAFNDTLQVVSTNQTFAGRSNVLITKLTSSPALFYDNYESGGDIGLFVDEGSGPGKYPGWLVLPNASKTTQSLTYYDSTEPGTNVRTTKVKTATYQGTQNLSIGSKTYTASKIVIVTAFSNGNSPAAETDLVVPELGGVVSIVTPYSVSTAGTPKNGFQLMMTGFELK